MNRCPVYLWKNCPGVIGSYCIECAGSCALIHMMTCVTNADLRNSHNRQKAAESLMASEKHFLASSHTKKNCRPPSVVLVAERSAATYLLLAYIQMSSSWLVVRNTKYPLCHLIWEELLAHLAEGLVAIHNVLTALMCNTFSASKWCCRYCCSFTIRIYFFFSFLHFVQKHVLQLLCVLCLLSSYAFIQVLVWEEYVM